MNETQILLNLGVKIQELRAKNRLSQAELGTRTGLKPEIISEIEEGNYKNITVVETGDIAEALGISLADLLEGLEEA